MEKISKYGQKPSNFKPLLYNRAENSNLRVADLFILGQRRWNVPLINQLFDPSKAQIIKRIHLSQIATSDMTVWHYSYRRIYGLIYL